MEVQTLIVIGLLLSMAGAGFSAWATIKNSQRQGERALQNAEFQKQLAAKAEENARLNQELAALTKESQAMITGGDGFCHLDAVTVGSHNDIELWPTNGGKFPLYDVTLKITDQDEFQKVMNEQHRQRKDGTIDPDELARRSMRTIVIGNMAPSTILTGGAAIRFPMNSDVEDRRFSVDSIARNGATRQLIWIKKVKEGRAVASRVYRGNVVIYEHATGLFPRDEHGNVPWDAKKPPEETK